MLKLTGRTRVSELQAGPPGLMRTLISTGIFREGDDPNVMIGELCWTFGFNPGILIMMLEAANVPDEVPPIDVAPYQAMGLVELVEHIEKVHHVYLREAMPRLAAMSAALSAAHAGDERLADLDKEIQAVTAELDLHLRHEEESLFPMVRDIVTKGTIAPTRCGSAVGGPIACMENEHEMTVQTLKKLRELTDDYTAPAQASAEWRELLAALARFDQDLQEHIYKENKILFPRALDSQGETRAAAAC
jgi:regulator of cell morphogenesis and NO signaling